MRMPGGALAKNSLLAMIFNGSRLIAQAATLILLARVIGPKELGSFVGTAGLAISAGAISGLGMGLVMYQEVAIRRESLGRYWRHSIATILWSGIIISIVGVLAAHYLLDIDVSIGAIIAIFLADAVFLPILANAANAVAATERIGLAAGLSFALSITRLLGVAAFSHVAVTRNVESYAPFYLAATFIVAIIALLAVKQVLRPQHFGQPLSSGTWRRGIGFMSVWATGASLGSLDKAIVLRYAGAEAAGIYTPAYRAATVLAFPVESMSMAALPRLFQRFAGEKAHRGLVASLFLVSAVYAVCVAALLWLAAPLLPLVLGAGFAEAGDVLRWLSIFVPCYALRTLGGVILMASGFKVRRALAEAIGVAAMLAFGALFLSRGDLVMAAIMITLVEGVIAVAHWTTVLKNNSLADQQWIDPRVPRDE